MAQWYRFANSIVWERIIGNLCNGYVASRGWFKITGFSSFMKFLWKKTYSLLLPLFTWTLLVGKYFFAQNFEIITIDDILNAMVHPGLWFLQVLFEIQLLFGLFCLLSYYLNKKDNLYISLILGGLIFMLPIIGYLWIDRGHFTTLVLFSFFFFIGSFISKYPVLQKFVISKYVFALSLILFLVLAAHWSIFGNTMDDLLKVVISIAAFVVLS